MKSEARLAVHVAILRQPYARMLLEGKKTVESRLTMGPLTPFRRIAPGDVIYFKLSGGGYFARAVAGKIEFHDRLTPSKVLALKRRFNEAVCGDEGYWNWKINSRYATFIALVGVEPADHGPALPPSSGLAWFTLEDPVPPIKPSFEVALTEPAIRNRAVRLPASICKPRAGEVSIVPADVFAPSAKTPAASMLRLHLAGDAMVETDVVRSSLIRWRGWGRWFKQVEVRPGDRLVFTRRGALDFAVTVARKTALPDDADHGPASATPRARPDVWRFVDKRDAAALIAAARREDLGPRNVDVTSFVSVPASLAASAHMHARKPGVLAGAALLPLIVRAYDLAVKLEPHASDGDALTPGQSVATFHGTLRSILAIERVALNFVTHLSGIATLTARYVEAVRGTRAKIYDTRKTIPGLRGLAKYAVVCGGGHSHRMGLYDAVLVKDNHIAHLGLDRLTASLAQAVAAARTLTPPVGFVEVEVDTLEQLERVLPAGPDIVLLDNMDNAQMRQAVALRDRVAPRIELEASGGVNLESVRAIAQTGVDRIAIGALTHSAPSLDLGLDIAPAGAPASAPRRGNAGSK